MISHDLAISRNSINSSDEEGGLRLDRFVDVLKRHVLLIAGVTAFTASGAVIQSLTEESVYSSEFELLTPPVTLETQIISTINPGALSNQSESVGVGLLDDTKLKILRSPRVMAAAVEELQKSYPGISYEEITSNLAIMPNDNGKTLTVQFQSDNPEKVTKVLDVVAETFLRYSLEDRQNDIYRGIDFVDQQLPSVKNRVDELEAELESLRQRSRLIDPLVQGAQLSEQMGSFISEQLNLQVQIEETEKLYQNLQQDLSEGGELAATSPLLESPRYQALLNQLLEVDSELAKERTLYLDNSPEIEVIAERRENIRPLLAIEGARVQEQVASYLRSLNAHDQALSGAIETLNERTEQLSTVARRYNSIQRNLGIASTNLNEFLTKREALRIDAAQRQTPWEILTPHGYPQASTASSIQNILLGGLFGLFLGSGIALAVDFINDKVYAVRSLKEATQAPLLGTIPYNRRLELGQSLILPNPPTGENGVVLEGYDSRKEQLSRPFLESFRLLANNIQLNSVDNYIKSLAVSSAVPNEGKSSISFYLAHASASLGKRTLLVDTDFRYPTLHRLCNVSNEKGLSSYIAEEAQLSEILIDLPTEENLVFMPSGPIPTDPTKILSSKKMETLYQHLYETFDMVIFDTPPLLGFADAFMVVRQTQGLLLTARLGHVTFSQLESAMDEGYVAKIPTIGIVANCSSKNDDKSYHYHQYYKGMGAEEFEEYLPYVNNTALNGKATGKTPWQKTLSNILRK